MKKLSIQQKLVIVFSSLMAISLITIATISYYYSKQIIQSMSNTQLEEQVEGIYKALQMSYKMGVEQQRISIDVAETKTLGAKLDNDKMIEVEAVNQVTKESERVRIPEMMINGEGMYKNPKIIKAIAKETHGTTTIFQKIPQGYLRITTNIVKLDGNLAIGTYIPNSSPVAQTLDSGKTFEGRAFVVNQFYLTAYRPIKDSMGKVIGAVYTGLSEQDSLVELIHELKSKKVFENGYFFISDTDGKLVAHPNQDLEGKVLTEMNNKGLSQLYEKLIKTKSGFIQLDNNDKDITNGAIYYAKHFDKMKWIICAKALKSDMFAPINRLQFITVVISIILIAIAVVLVYLIGSGISRPILKISDMLIRSSSEVGQAAQHLTEASNSLSDGAGKQAASVEETTASLEELNGMIKQNEESNGQNDENAGHVFKESENANHAMDSLKTAMNEIKASNDRIDELVTIINEIADKTQVMDEIVFQTKLLSFNASVEAERAGEHGRGFAVVAQEVGNLASMSGKAAQEIAEIVRNSISEASGITTNNRKKVEDGSRFVVEAAEAMSKIKHSAEQVKSSSTQILEASKQQSVGMNQISQAMSIIDGQTQETSSTAAETAATSDKLNEEVQNLNGLINGLISIVNGEKK